MFTRRSTYLQTWDAWDRSLVKFGPDGQTNGHVHLLTSCRSQKVFYDILGKKSTLSLICMTKFERGLREQLEDLSLRALIKFEPDRLAFFISSWLSQKVKSHCHTQNLQVSWVNYNITYLRGQVEEPSKGFRKAASARFPAICVIIGVPDEPRPHRPHSPWWALVTRHRPQVWGVGGGVHSAVTCEYRDNGGFLNRAK